MQIGALPQAPIWSDLRTFDAGAWRGAVDLVCAGFPCQDISSAGKRAGIHGKRSGLWFEVARVIRDVGPRIVFLENVDALVVRGLDVVLGTLAEMGFDAEWGVFSAAETGAPHLRERCFILAVVNAECGDNSKRTRHARGTGGERSPIWGRSGSNGTELGDPDSARLARWSRERPRRLAAETGEVLADAACERSREAGRLQPGQPLRAARSGCLSEFPPGRYDWRAWQRVFEVDPYLAPALPQSEVRRLADGLELGSRTDWLRLLGNGVVPHTAEHAYRTLRGRLMADGLWPLVQA